MRITSRLLPLRHILKIKNLEDHGPGSEVAGATAAETLAGWLAGWLAAGGPSSLWPAFYSFSGPGTTDLT